MLQHSHSFMRLRILIVDDEPIARKILREELELLSDVEIIGEADNGLSALQLIQECSPNLVFLDLQMPGMGGLDVVRQLTGGKTLPVIVIVTAYDEYAVQAFEAGAIDYLMKPVAQNRLIQSVSRARQLIRKTSDVADYLGKLQEVATPADSSLLARKIVGRAGEEYFLLSPHEVLAFQSDGDLVWIFTAKRKYLASHTLRHLQERLNRSSFRRVHRNALVNMDHVRKMSSLSSQRWLLTLDNGQEFIVSKRLVRNIREILGHD